MKIKVENITKTTIVLVVASALFDFITSQILWTVGDTTTNGKVVFVELNPLYHMLGQQMFSAIYLLFTAIIVVMLIYTDKACTEGKQWGLLKIANLSVIGIFAVPHLLMGLNNLYLIIQYVSSPYFLGSLVRTTSTTNFP